MNDSIKPHARHHELIIQELPDELLVYDLAANKAYCLNRSAMIVWNLCDGGSTVADLANHLATALNAARSEGTVWLALEELKKCDLLLEIPKRRAVEKGKEVLLTRRELTRRLGIAAASLPMIIALVAPTAAQNASRRANGEACGSLSEVCVSGCCDPVSSVCAQIEVCDSGTDG